MMVSVQCDLSIFHFERQAEQLATNSSNAVPIAAPLCSSSLSGTCCFLFERWSVSNMGSYKLQADIGTSDMIPI